jgi:hypothetical protein
VALIYSVGLSSMRAAHVGVSHARVQEIRARAC